MSDHKKRQNEEEMDDEKIKKRNRHDQCYQIIEAIENLHQALKPRYVRLDDLVQNRGLQHLALKIFRKLDYKSLANCRLVSKDWKEFIDSDTVVPFEAWKIRTSKSCIMTKEEDERYFTLYSLGFHCA